MENNVAGTLRKRPNPYVGPRPFNKDELLYGRDVEVRDLVSLLCAERIVLLYSPSGAGKTSLIHAMLIRKMEERKFFVRAVARVNHETKYRSGERYNRYIFSLLSYFEAAFPEDEQISEEELAAMTLDAYLTRRPRPADMAYQLFIFDQFEEILTLNPTDQEEKLAFFGQLGRVLKDDTCWCQQLW